MIDENGDFEDEVVTYLRGARHVRALAEIGRNWPGGAAMTHDELRANGKPLKLSMPSFGPASDSQSSTEVRRLPNQLIRI
jgi:hypothetical protein